jgi:energy-coupling factor transporter ATP-binding protein EcfA2
VTARLWSIGSRWLRWDPHIHAPGTLRNDQFGGDWDAYVKKIENASPPAIALGVTDYFCLRGYKEVVQRQANGALQNLSFVFPNVEVRLTVETRNGKAINLHLLVCPDDPNHIELFEEKLGQLQFRYRDQTYPCTETGLVRLGREHQGNTSLPSDAALSAGANQFKIGLDDLRELRERDEWFRTNIVTGVAAGNDGLGGLSKDAAFSALREELGRFADVIFSSNEGDREYWLGNHPDFGANGQTPKPCLHGCDAHSPDAVLAPAHDRRCWIRAEPTFDGLRQTLFEPDRRVHIGENPPSGAAAGETIDRLVLDKAGWLKQGEIPLNDGLVTVIGAKGSGKTALADLLALAADAEEEEPGPASFLQKAGDLLAGTTATIHWADGGSHTSDLPGKGSEGREPRVRYLSQQFVERLCSSQGLGEPLVDEIESVVFSALSEEDRLECSSFSELRTLILQESAVAEESERDEIRRQTESIAELTETVCSLESIRARAAEAKRSREAIEAAIKTIPINIGDAKIKAQQAADEKLRKLKGAIAAEERKVRQLTAVLSGLARLKRSTDAEVERLETNHAGLIDDATWQGLRLNYAPEALAKVENLKKEAQARIESLRRDGLPPPEVGGLNALIAEHDKLTKALGLDQAKAQRRSKLEKQLSTAKAAEISAQRALTKAQGAGALRKKAQAARLASYEKVFEALDHERELLERLYGPLKERIEADARLSKLAFVVKRNVNLQAWAAHGETLFDLRRPPFQHRGAIEEVGRNMLLQPWKTGAAAEARQAMESFLDQYADAAVQSLATGSTLAELGEWLFSTDHISVQYGIQYEGVEIAHLSPGSRGVVLLTLYLALDQWDRRPLIIDQPEENLDPRSVYEDLVPFFREAARRRQIIMVTHNANLVVNTDSDQVIVAEAERHAPNELPTILYTSGGLEDPGIRNHVCRLLEGGEDAFRRRGERYEVRK